MEFEMEWNDVQVFGKNDRIKFTKGRTRDMMLGIYYIINGYGYWTENFDNKIIISTEPFVL